MCEKIILELWFGLHQPNKKKSILMLHSKIFHMTPGG